MENYTGNLSTIIKFISMTIAGWFIGILTAHNLNLGLDATQISQFICAIIFFALSYVDARYPNTLKIFGNELTTVSEMKEYSISDIDPATEYEMTGDSDD